MLRPLVAGNSSPSSLYALSVASVLAVAFGQVSYKPIGSVEPKPVAESFLKFIPMI